mmetsp:Transcript_9272/g.22637  ORF Transcript_9272/g.22637 Transcript_9272/m.22637 type:complete len:97 (+) Transcript_9272:100-390(+)
MHGNVPTSERRQWTHWLCQSLARIVADVKGSGGGNRRPVDDGWIAVCVHVEKVKSFAPKVDHVVADVFLGPQGLPKMPRPCNVGGGESMPRVIVCD